MFIKVGRIYWIKPTPIPYEAAKIRPAIAIAKYDNGKTIFIHLGSSPFGEPSSMVCTHMLWKALHEDTFRPNREIAQTFVHLDASKPEWNTSVIKPHINKGGGFIDVDSDVIDKIRQVYFSRLSTLEQIRFSKAGKALLISDKKECKKQLMMVKDSHPNKHKKLNIETWIERFENIMVSVQKNIDKKSSSKNKKKK